jgi:hypothetical protein
MDCLLGASGVSLFQPNYQIHLLTLILGLNLPQAYPFQTWQQSRCDVQHTVLYFTTYVTQIVQGHQIVTLPMNCQSQQITQRLQICRVQFPSHTATPSSGTETMKYRQKLTQVYDI